MRSDPIPIEFSTFNRRGSFVDKPGCPAPRRRSGEPRSLKLLRAENIRWRLVEQVNQARQHVVDILANTPSGFALKHVLVSGYA